MTLAIDGGAPVRTAPFPRWPAPDPGSAAAVADVVRSGKWFRVDGTEVDSFEERFAALQQASFATCMSSGTTALDTALRAVGVGRGDEVIVPAYTFIASAMAVVYVGAVPIFADIDPRTHDLDPSAVRAAIGPRTKAIMPVHLAGRPCDMTELTELAAGHGLAVVEDAAQAIGAEWQGRRVGAIGDVGAFSFQNSKNITAGEGGAVITDDSRLADRVYSLANVGRTRGGGWYEHPLLGYNLRMTEMQGALLNRQLERHAERQAIRTRNAALLSSLVAEIPGVAQAPPDPRITAHGLHLVLLRIPRATGRKDRMVAATHAEGIPVGGGYPQGLHRNAALVEAARRNTASDYTPAACPATDAAAADTIVIPHFLLLGDERAVHDIAAALRKVIDAIDGL